MRLKQPPDFGDFGGDLFNFLQIPGAKKSFKEEGTFSNMSADTNADNILTAIRVWQW